MRLALGLSIAWWLGFAAMLPRPWGEDIAAILLPIAVLWLITTIL